MSQRCNALSQCHRACLIAFFILLPVMARPDAFGQNDHPFLALNLTAPTAEVRAIRFQGDQIFSAGMDKLVRRWQFNETTGLQPRESFRWPIEHGNRGAIYSMDVSPDGSRVAIAGLGFSGGVGEVGQIDLASGKLTWLETQGHSQTANPQQRIVIALAYSPDGNWLVSRDVSGRILARDPNQPAGIPREVIPSFAVVENEFWPMSVTATDVVYSAPVDANAQRPPLWEIRLMPLSDQAPQTARKLLGNLTGTVLSLDAAPTGTTVVASDASSQARILYWENAEANSTAINLGNQPAFSLALDVVGKRVLAGTFADGNQPGKVSLFDLSTKEAIFTKVVTQPVWACALSPEAERFAFVQGNNVLAGVVANESNVAESIGGTTIADVSFLSNENQYPVRFSVLQKSGQRSQRVFDLKKRELRQIDATPIARIDQTQASLAGWTASLREGGQVVEIINPQRQLRRIQLDRRSHGVATSLLWIADANGQPDALAVGTAASDFCIHVFDHLNGLSLRAFRGHQGPVTSIAVSPDRRYLVSGSTDSTLRFWSLEYLRQGRRMLRRWGFEFQNLGTRYRVSELIEPGSLFDKGVRIGDVLEEIAWIDPSSNERKVSTDLNEIYRVLQDLPWDVQIGFQFSRGGKPIPKLQVAGWHDYLTVLIAEPNWIAWTPSGYYTCSAGGERLIGWQVNGELGNPPTFYEAIKFRKTFHRPRAIELLLESGRLSAAFAAATPKPPPGKVAAVEQPKQVAEVLPPKIELLEPKVNELVIQKPELKIVAKAEAAANSPPPKRLKLLIGGSPPPEHVRELSGKGDSEESWLVKLEPGIHEIQILAETDQGFETTRLLKVTYEPEKEVRNLYVLAIGVAEYLPPLSLTYPGDDASNVSKTLEQHAVKLYDRVETNLITDLDATQEGILDGLRWLSKKMTQRDVGIIFFAGHGLRNADGFYFIPVNGQIDKLKDTCIHEDIVKQFCREMGGRGSLIMMLDACHSGAVQVDRLALELADPTAYNVLAMVSSSGEEKSYEHPTWRAGAFSRALTDGLSGEADSPKFPDGSVDFFELYVYVYSSVREMVSKLGGTQTPLMNVHYQVPFALTKTR